MAAADLHLGPFGPRERDRWAELWAGYHLFYGRPSVAPELYDLAWRRLRGGPPFHGFGRALIGAGTAFARAQGCVRYYWTTHESNAAARALYDRVARDTGSLRYDAPL